MAADEVGGTCGLLHPIGISERMQCGRIDGRPGGRSLEQMQAAVKAACETAGMKPTDQIPLLGPLPVTVPGIVDAWFALHEKFGKLPMSEDLAPAIYYATHGFPVTQVVAE